MGDPERLARIIASTLGEDDWRRYLSASITWVLGQQIDETALQEAGRVICGHCGQPFPGKTDSKAASRRARFRARELGGA